MLLLDDETKILEKSNLFWSVHYRSFCSSTSFHCSSIIQNTFCWMYQIQCHAYATSPSMEMRKRIMYLSACRDQRRDFSMFRGFMRWMDCSKMQLYDAFFENWLGVSSDNAFSANNGSLITYFCWSSGQIGVTIFYNKT